MSFWDWLALLFGILIFFVIGETRSRIMKDLKQLPKGDKTKALRRTTRTNLFMVHLAWFASLFPIARGLTTLFPGR